MRKIAVIGAGITGVTTARALHARGFDVTIFDRNRYAAMETSFANGGQLSASNAEVWNSWGIILKGMKWMLKADAPLSVNPWPTWHKYSWMAEFMANIPNYRRNTIETVRLALQARELLESHAEQYGFDFAAEHRGILHVYSDRKDYAHATRVNKLLVQGGLDRFAVTVDEMLEIEPTLQGDLIGGYYTPSDFTGDIHRYTTGLASAMTDRGVDFRYGTSIDKVEHIANGVILSHGREEEVFDGTVICAGVRSRDFAAQLGDRVNIYPVKGYSITVNLHDAASQAAAPWVSLLDDKAKIVTSRLGADKFRLAGTAEFNGYNRDIRQDRIDPLVRWCETHFPCVSTEDVTPWAGLRPMMPNMLPRVGAGRQTGVFYNTGHGHLGWTLSAATAELVGDAVLAGSRTPTPSRPTATKGLEEAAAI
ncbi:MAG: D-amino acid dehydrogenase [Pseudomonadota bacterium]